MQIGGLAIGESSTERKKVVEHLNSILPIDKPRYVMGLGDTVGLIRFDSFWC